MARVLGCCLVVSFGIALSGTVHAACQVEMLEMPVKMVGSRAVASVGINGTPVPLTVDSGAFFSFLTDAAAAQLNLAPKRNDQLRVEGLTGKVDTRVAVVDKLKLFKGDFSKVQFIVGGNEPGGGTMGLMGRNILSFTDTEYDLAHGMIRFLFPSDGCAESNMAYWAGTSPVSEVELIENFDSKTPAIRAFAKLNGRELRVMFDTGAHTIVSARAAKRSGIAEGDMTADQMVYGAGRGRAQGWTARFQKFEVGGEAILNNTLHVGDFDLDDADMLVGIDFFLSHRIYVSKAQSRMFFTYNGGPVFALDRSDDAVATTTGADQPASGTSPMSADQLARRGASYAARGDYVHALADLDQACALAPTSAALYEQRGAIQASLERPAKALEDFDKALELDGAQLDARLQRARLRAATRNRDGAMADLDVLDKTLSPQAQMRLTIASLYLSVDRPARTVAQLDQWLSTHPNDIGRGSAHNSRCWARARLGSDLDKALDDCDEAVGSDAKNAAFLDSRGWVYLRLGQYGKALADFDHAIEYQPTIASSLYGRGLTKNRMGNDSRGDADLAAARAVQPDIDREVARAGLTSTLPQKP